MSKSVLIIATLDTKGPEAAYIRDGLNRLGIKTTVIDTGILGEPLGIVPDISHEDLAIFGGITLQELQNSGTRGRAVERMRTFVIEKVKELFSKGEVLGAIGIGGAEGSVMGAGALMTLPIGVPKLVLSPIASGRHEFGPLVGTSDMLVMHTVIDILGLNHISKTIYDNAIAAMAGLVNHGHELSKPPAGSKYVAVTMLGNTTTAVMALQKELEQAGFEVVTFHANGVGGPAMEELAEAGQFVGIIDFTPSEIVGTLVGGIHYGGPRRMKRAGVLGIPQILVPACVDFSVHHTTSIPDEFKDRPIYDHNPEFALARCTKEEMGKLGAYFAECANTSMGPTEIVIPGEGYSIPNVPGGVFWDRDADAVFESELMKNIKPEISIEKLPLHANSKEFGIAVAQRFLSLISARIK
ncbi:MAG: Tm-1-like ATP-binding domain-containing protein [Actinobacteria bacterium]|nr:Tm-1-like ATP-binding domain-containing protein [Actinomycetota bacterium]